MKGMTCPICGRRLDGPESEWPSRPFCSAKCRTIDLGRWLDGRNNLPVVEVDDEALREGLDDS